MNAEVRNPAPIVEVFSPSQAPHLAVSARRLEEQLRRQLEALPPAALERMLEVGAAIANDRAAFARFRNRIPIKPPGV